MKTVETEIKYSGYLEQQKRSMEKMKQDERRVIPAGFDYRLVSGLSTRDEAEAVARCGRRRWGRRAGSGSDAGGGELDSCAISRSRRERRRVG